MSIKRIVRCALTAGSVFALATSVHAQTAMQQCESGISEVQAQLDAHAEDAAKKIAADNIEKATTAHAAGDYDECMLMVKEAAGSLRCTYGAGSRLECPN
ncbi:hypothetical protein DLJ53_27510 [Acuticoccus sediminis]|uniref:Uncharacterized protein n=1 Tax=Acuticoccus sediminis TaxID=2184697 RepID=A0A8B2NNZ2_9HYPH|nr:hypothetical protein [Acuticoccus sediminis]RAH98437.1 hypothetical protein DLJ53_27510 [Acuticoccus sediminis]